jgi:hypothetical protein
MISEFLVSKEEKKFYIKNCPIRINLKSFKKGYLNTLAKEKGSGRTILFHKVQCNIFEPKVIGDLLILASAYDAEIIVFFVENISIGFEQVFNWLQKISKENICFLVIKLPFNYSNI